MELRELSGRRLEQVRGDVPREVVAAELNISVSALQMYENGKRTPKDDVKKKLAEYYGVKIGWLFFGE